MKFNYQARTKDGDTQVGQVEASSKEAAINLLQRHDFYVTFLEEAKAPIYAKNIRLFSGVSRKDIVLFSRQLSIMFKSKVSLIEALRVIGNEMKNPSFKEDVLKISEEVEGGMPFSKAISKYPKVFSPFYVAMVKSGEVSGKLADVLDYLADHLEKEYHTISKAQGAMVYPALIVLVVIGVMAMMVYFVVPNLAVVLQESEQELPAVTKFVLAMTGFLRAKGWILGLLFIVLVAAFIRFYKSSAGKKITDKYFLKLPLVGGLIQLISVSRFSENLSTLISGGLPIAQALEITGEIIGNESYKKAILQARDNVRKGEPISSTLAQYPGLFSSVFSQMVLVGEKTGTLDSTLMNVVDFYQREIERSIDGLLSFMEPALIIFLGGIVGGMIFSVLIPLYNMMAV